MRAVDTEWRCLAASGTVEVGCHAAPVMHEVGTCFDHRASVERFDENELSKA